MSIWNAAVSTEAPPLTLELLLETFEKIKNQPPHPCSLGQHIVSSKALYRTGWYICGNCCAPVEVTVPLAER